jgi:hypothetical protein
MRTWPIILPAVLLSITACGMQPRNHLRDCLTQCPGSTKSRACHEFCDCIHTEGRPLNTCLDAYEAAPADSLRVP